MIERHITPQILKALGDTPVVFLQGARRTGKSTLARHIAATAHPARYITLDDVRVLATATEDPMGFVAGLEGPVVLDEVQRAPDLLLAIKAAVDRDPVPGRFFLTGSAQVMVLPRVADSLAGRVEFVTLWPLSQAEIEGRWPGFVDALFEPGPLAAKCRLEEPSQVMQRALVGGYPEAVQRASLDRREAWFRSYISAIMQREVRELVRINGLSTLPRLLEHVAARATGLLNRADLGRDAGLPRATLDRYLALLQAVFLVDVVPAWAANIGKRLAKAPKLFLNDTGLLSHLLGLEMTGTDSSWLGRLIENFAVLELLKGIPQSEARPRLSHLRTHAGQEVDVVLETLNRRIVGIEVKSSGTVHPRDVAGLRALQEATGDRFVRGIVLYLGAEVIPYASNIHAVPITALWQA
jgi:predicted AAA+ superfamily ATPase